MNKEIELVEDAVNSVSFAIKQYQQELRELKLSSQEKKLKDLLENVPQAVYHKTETNCYACVDGVTFDIENNDCFYGFRAKHKMLIKLFNFGWVINKTTFFFDDCESKQFDLQMVLEQHLKAIKWENKTKDPLDGAGYFV